jgi:hypothetical protein
MGTQRALRRGVIAVAAFLAAGLVAVTSAMAATPTVTATFELGSEGVFWVQGTADYHGGSGFMQLQYKESSSAADWTRSVEGAANPRTFTAVGLQPDRTYVWKVVARNADTGEIGESALHWVTCDSDNRCTESAPAPPEPSFRDISVTSKSRTGFSVAGTGIFPRHLYPGVGGVVNASMRMAYREAGTSSWEHTNWTTVAAPAHRLGSTFDFPGTFTTAKLQISGNGQLFESAVSTVRTDPSAPAVADAYLYGTFERGFKIGARGSFDEALDWNLLGLRYRPVGSSEWASRWERATPNGQLLVVQDLAPNTDYEWQVEARDATGQSATSEVRQVRVGRFDGYDIGAVTSKSFRVRLAGGSFTDGDEALLYVRPKGAASYGAALLATVKDGVVEWDVTGLASGAQYEIQALNTPADRLWYRGPESTVATLTCAEDAACPKAPKLSAAPSFTGTPLVGKTLAAAKLSATGVPKATVSYQWLRGGEPIPGATARKYQLVDADRGKKVTVQVTASNSQGTVSKKAPAVRVNAKPAVTTAPVLKGTPKVGRTLKVTAGKWARYPSAMALSFRWLRDGKVVQKGIAKSYVLTAKDAGRKIQVEVTAQNQAGKTKVLTNVLGPVK